ncbi:MAG: aminoacyl-tRNA hydrolase [Chitinophagales bacterium]
MRQLLKRKKSRRNNLINIIFIESEGPYTTFAFLIEGIPAVKYLIAGLGNIGSEYMNTRHNAGFLVAEELAQRHNAIFKDERLAAKTTFRLKNKILHVIKPATYMNLSGRAIKYWMDKLEIPHTHILVITDDIHLPFGKIRIKTKGSHGGHNGLANIEQMIGTSEYTRLRFGVGNTFQPGSQVEYVLGNWSDSEKATLSERIQLCADAAESFVLAGAERTMNYFNTK